MRESEVRAARRVVRSLVLREGGVERESACSSSRTNASGKLRYGARKEVTGATSRRRRDDSTISQRADASSMRSNAVWVTPWHPSSWPASTRAGTAAGYRAGDLAGGEIRRAHAGLGEQLEQPRRTLLDAAEGRAQVGRAVGLEVDRERNA